MSTKSPVVITDNFFIGEDRVLRFTVVDADGVAVNITGWALEWVLRVVPASTAASLTKTTGGGGITITSGAGGICEVAIADADTINLGEDRYFYTLRRSDSGNEVVLAFGEFWLQQAATR